jgi:parvulin-like peptidyl-prolyl isomerase
MVRMYKPEEIAFGMQKFVENLGDTARTSRQRGISERTLRRWKYKYQINTILTINKPPSEQDNTVYQRYLQIRDNLLKHIERLYEQMDTQPENAAELAIALSRLIDRLSKLENLLDNRHFTIIVTFQKPEESEYITITPNGDEMPF